MRGVPRWMPVLIDALVVSLALKPVGPVAGDAFGLLPVYSDSRAACALWVVIALPLTFVAGLIFPSPRERARSHRRPRATQPPG